MTGPRADMNKFISVLSETYGLRNLGKPKRFVGIQIKYSADSSILLYQSDVNVAFLDDCEAGGVSILRDDLFPKCRWILDTTSLRSQRNAASRRMTNNSIRRWVHRTGKFFSETNDANRFSFARFISVLPA